MPLTKCSDLHAIAKHENQSVPALCVQVDALFEDAYEHILPVRGACACTCSGEPLAACAQCTHMRNTDSETCPPVKAGWPMSFGSSLGSLASPVVQRARALPRICAIAHAAPNLAYKIVSVQIKPFPLARPDFRNLTTGNESRMCCGKPHSTSLSSHSSSLAGCTFSSAMNFNALANYDDGSCTFG